MKASSLLIDASQGIEAQTLTNCYLALEHSLEIVAVLNKIDLPAADPDRYAAEIERVLGIGRDEITPHLPPRPARACGSPRRRCRAHPGTARRPATRRSAH